VLGIDGTRFTLSGRPTFLLGISYYAALGAPEDSVRRDLDDMQRYGFNWLRVWATWDMFDHNISAVDGTGEPLPCRVLVRPAGGECVIPDDAVDLVIGPDRWFYSDGRLQLDVPAGRVELRVEHGLEYKRVKQSVVVPEAGLEKTLRLVRWIDMRKLGYRYGEDQRCERHLGKASLVQRSLCWPECGDAAWRRQLCAGLDSYSQ